MFAHAHINIRIRTHTCIRARTHTYTHMHAQTHACTHTLTNTHKHTRTHTLPMCLHTHTHTPFCGLSHMCFLSVACLLPLSLARAHALSLSFSHITRTRACDTIHRQDKWEELQPMKIARTGLGVGELEGLLYAVGGRAESGYRLRSTDCCNVHACARETVRRVRCVCFERSG